MDFGFNGFGMEVIGVCKTPGWLRSQQFADHGLTRPGYSHEHKNHSFLLISCGEPAQWLPGYCLLYVVHNGGGIPVVTWVPAEDFAPGANDGRRERVGQGIVGAW